MGDASPRQLLSQWGGGDGDVSSEDAALTRWRAADRVAVRKFRGHHERLEATGVCFKLGTVGSSTERTGNGIKRQRPQSACPAASRQRQRDKTHVAVAFEARTSPIRSGRERPQSARPRSSTRTTPRLEFPRGELADQLEASKWTGMLHRSPGFRQSRLQRLEAETYALLRFALGKTPSRGVTEAADNRQHQRQQSRDPNTWGRADDGRPSSVKQWSKHGGDKTAGIVASTAVACGSGAQVARSKKQQRQAHTTASRRRNQGPQTELETGRESMQDRSRVEGAGSEDERRAVREKTRRRGNETKLKLKKTRVSSARQESCGAVNDDPAVLGRRTAARSHWTVRASLALGKSSGGDLDGSPGVDEYILAVTEPPVLPRGSAKQSTKVWRDTTSSQPQKKSQAPSASVRETQLHREAFQLQCGAHAVVGGKKPERAEANRSVDSGESNQREDAVTAERLQRAEGQDAPVQSLEMNYRVADSPSAEGGESVAARGDEQQEGATTAALSSESSGVSSHALPPTLVASVALRLEARSEVDGRLRTSNEDFGQARGAVGRESETTGLGGLGPPETSLSAFALIAETRPSDDERGDEAEKGDSQPSELSNGQHEAPSGADSRIDASVAAQPIDADDCELVGISQAHTPDNCESLEQNDVDEGKPTAVAVKCEPTDGMSDATELHIDGLDCRVDSTARLHMDSSTAAVLFQEALSDSRTGFNTPVSGSNHEVDAGPSTAAERSDIEFTTRIDDSTVGLTLLTEKLHGSSVVAHGMNASDHRSSFDDGEDATLEPCAELDACQPVPVKLDKAEDRDCNVLAPLDKPVELVPALEAAVVGPLSVCNSDDSDDCPSGESSGFGCDGVALTQRTAVEPADQFTDDQSKEEALPASTEDAGSCNSVEDWTIAEVPDGHIKISSSLGSCAVPIDDSAIVSRDVDSLPLPLDLSTDSEHIGLMDPASADEGVAVDLSMELLSTPRGDATTLTDTDNVESSVADPLESSTTEVDYTGSRSSSCGEAGETGSEATLATTLDVFEQLPGGCNGENGDELLPDAVEAHTVDLQLASRHASAVVSISESDTSCSDNVGVDTLTFVSVNTNEQLRDCQLGDPSSMPGCESLVVEDVFDTSPSDERELSTHAVDGAAPSDNQVPSAIGADDFATAVLDPEQGGEFEATIQSSTSSSSTIPDYTVPADRVHTDGEEPTPPLISKQVALLVGSECDLRRLCEDQSSAIVCADVIPVDPPQLDNVTLLSTECALRIQRQYRCFVARRLMLDQLQFNLKQHRRQTRKKAKRESIRDSVVVVAPIEPADPPLPSEEGFMAGSAVALSAGNQLAPVEEKEVASASSQGVGAVNGGDDGCLQAKSEPRFSASCDGVDSSVTAEFNVDEPKPQQREGEEAVGRDGSRPAATEGGDVEPTNDLPAAAGTLSDSMDAPSRHDDCLDTYDLPHSANLEDLAETEPSRDDRLPASQLDDCAVKDDILPVGHSTLAEVTSLGNGDEEDKVVHDEQSDQVGRWERYLDAANNKSFYYNPKTGESRWTAPTEDLNIDSDFDQEVVPSEPEHEVESPVDTVEVTDPLTSHANWEVRRHSSHLGELRGTWQAFVDEASQLPFYYNLTTGESTWATPMEFQTTGSSSWSAEIAADAASLTDEDQWVACVDSASGMPYYANLKTNETSWEKPQQRNDGVMNARAPVVPIDLCGLALGGELEVTGGERVDLCGLAFGGDGALADVGCDGGEDVQALRITTTGDGEGAEAPTYEEDYVIDLEEGTES